MLINLSTVKLWGGRVGVVAWDPLQGTETFEFDPAFLNNDWDVSPIKMPLDPSRRIYSFPDLRDTPFRGLPGLLADVLPDKFGNELINAWLAREGRPADSMNPVEMLCYIGNRGMGALEFEPAQPKGNNRSTIVELESLVEMAGTILSQRKDFSVNLSKDEEKALLDILKIGTSAGGARAKAIIAYNPITREVRSGQADAPKGFTHWIIKFDGVRDSQLGITSGYGRVEMAYHEMVKDCGIEMTECRLLEENDRAHFMTRRFDRPAEGRKIHVQSFAAMQHFDFSNITSFSYEQLFQTMRQLHLPYPQAEELFRRMVFNVLARNCDDHAKNFAFMMDRSGTWQLSPAFDMCHTYRPESEWVKQQSLSVNGKRLEIDHGDFIAVAKGMSIKKPESIIKRVNEVVKNWAAYARRSGVSKERSEAIAKTLIHL